MEYSNSIIVEERGGTSALTECLNFPPVKFLNPKPLAGCCQVYISNYGGGLVDGDSLKMRVRCRSGARLYLGTQSSTKVYRSHGGKGCAQETIGVAESGSLAVVCPDPVVPFEGSRFHQAQTWTVHPGANLVLFDWLLPGRAARGEVFAYRQLLSELRVLGGRGEPLLADRFSSEPHRRDPLRCGRFGRYTSLLCIYLVGAGVSRMMETLEPQLLALNRPATPDAPGAWIGVGKKENVGYVVRVMGGDRRDAQPAQDLVFSALAEAEWLGFNPWSRRW